MKKWCMCLALVFLLSSAFLASSAPEKTTEPHRSPSDITLLPGQKALTANQTSDTVSLVDLAAGVVLSEVACGPKPSGVAASKDGKRAAASNLWSDSIALFD